MLMIKVHHSRSCPGVVIGRSYDRFLSALVLDLPANEWNGIGDSTCCSLLEQLWYAKRLAICGIQIVTRSGYPHDVVFIHAPMCSFQDGFLEAVVASNARHLYTAAFASQSVEHRRSNYPDSSTMHGIL